MLVEEMGYSLGQYASGIIKKLDLHNEKVPMVLTGSFLKHVSPY
jgi:hypothetical protein